MKISAVCRSLQNDNLFSKVKEILRIFFIADSYELDDLEILKKKIHIPSNWIAGVASFQREWEVKSSEDTRWRILQR